MIKKTNGFGIIIGLFIFFFIGVSIADARKVRIMFLHHSTGNDLIEKGSVRQGLTALGYEFYDHGYNEQGLRMANGQYAHTNFKPFRWTKDIYYLMQELGNISIRLPLIRQ